MEGARGRAGPRLPRAALSRAQIDGSFAGALSLSRWRVALMRSLAFDARWAEGEPSQSTVEARLAAAGLACVDRLRLRGVDSKHTDAPIAVLVRDVLDSLGPAFRAFGRY